MIHCLNANKITLKLYTMLKIHSRVVFLNKYFVLELKVSQYFNACWVYG